MVIHAHGGTITVTIGDEGVEMVLKDTRPRHPRH